MSYRLSSKKRQARKRFWLRTVAGIFLVTVAAILFAITNEGFTNSTDGALEAGNDSVSFFSALLANKDTLLAENDRLTRELDQRTLDRQMQSQIVERNRELTRLLGRTIDPEYVLAGVVKKPPFNPYDIYTLDAGTAEGVTIGDLVAYSDFVALGRINAVTETGSKALLFSAPQNTTEVIVNGETFTVEGKGSGVLQLSVARDAGIVAGDQVLLPGYQLISIGTVQEVLADPQDGFARVMITTPVNIQAVDLVRVEAFRSSENSFNTEVTSDSNGA